MKFKGKTLNEKLLTFFLCLCVALPGVSGSALASDVSEAICTCGTPNGEHLADCPLYVESKEEDDGSDADKTEAGAKECTCASPDGTHEETCPLYKASEAEGSVDEADDEGAETAECTCGSADGTHAETCPLYKKPDTGNDDADTNDTDDDAAGIPECTCTGLNGEHEKTCPLYQSIRVIEDGQDEIKYEIHSGLMPNGRPGQEYYLLQGATVSPEEDGDGNPIILRVSSVTSSDAEWVWDGSDMICPEKEGVVFNILYQAYVRPEGEEEHILAEYEFLLRIGDGESIGKLLDGDYAYISSAVMKSDSSTDSGYAVSTGTAPWDMEETEGDPGVDQRANDNLLRTFDVASYTVEINNRVRENSPYQFYESGTLHFEFILPFEKDKAIFEESSMGWLQSKKDVVYTIDQDSYTYNGQKCQVLRGSFLWEPSGENPAAIGAGMLDLNIAVRALALKNGDTMQPLFTFWMDGNEAPENGLVTGSGAECDKHGETEYRTVIGQEITITAVPRYNVKLYWDGSATHQKLGTFDFNSGNEGAPNQGLGMVNGRMVTFGMEFHMEGKSAEHGLRGLEIPQGEITFDLRLRSFYKPDSDDLVETTDKYPVLLWSVDENTNSKNGSNGRTLYASSPFSSNSAWNRATGSGMQRYNSCYDGGTWSGTAEGNIVHITISDYQVDLTKLPNACASQSAKGTWYYSPTKVGEDYWKIQTACLSTGRCTVVQPFIYDGNSAVEDFGAGQFDTRAYDINLMAAGQSGQSLPPDASTGNQAKTNDDKVAVAMRLDPSLGSFNQVIRYMKYDDFGSPLTSGCSENGEDWITVGSHLTIADIIHVTQVENMTSVAAMDQLIKFDDRFFEPENCTVSGQGNSYTVRILYGAKPEKTGWDHKGLEPSEEGYDDDMKNATTDELIFFPTLKALKESGYVCVALLTEWRGGSDTEFLVATYLRGSCKADSSLVGNVFMVTHESRGWNKAVLAESVAQYLDKETMELTNADYREYFKNGQFPTRRDGQVHSYSEYPDPTWRYEPENRSGLLEYQKSVYDESGWAEGSVGSKYGDSCRVIGAVTEISQKCAQTTSAGNEKLAYDMDTNQRIADFVVYPSLVRADTGAASTDAEDIVTNVYVECELPAQLKYIPNSAHLGGDYVQTGEGKQGTVEGGALQNPETYVNEAGNVVLRWVFKDQIASHEQNTTELQPIHFSCDIGNPGGEDDVENNTTLTIHSKIWCDQDSFRGFKAAFNNLADTGIMVTGNSAASLSKVADHRVVNPEDGMGFTINVGNNSGESMNVFAIDSLPYIGDSAGSSFHGEYYVSELTMKQMDIDSNISLYYTTDAAQRGKTSIDYGLDDFTTGSTWQLLSMDSASGAVTIPTQDAEDFRPVAIAAVGRLPGNQTLKLHVTLKFPEGQAGDYVANRLTNGGMESYARVYIASRILEGKTWLDANRDGLQDKAEEKISGIKVTLMKLKKGGDASNFQDYEAVKGADGNNISVLTGETMDVHSGTVTNYGQGRYRFTNLPEGTYGVLFEGGTDYAILDTTASPVGMGSNDEIDSDAAPVYAEDGSLLHAFEPGIVMPSNDKITTTVYTSANHDLGIYPSVYELKLSKNVTGTMGDRNQEFVFHIILKDADGNPITAAYPYVGGTAQDESDASQSKTLEFTDGAAQVKLKHGQSITIKGLPRHCSYEVSEGEAGYQVSWSSEEDRSCTDLTEDKQLVCTNTLNTAIPTGIRMDFWPWLLCVMGVLAAAAAWLFVPGKGRRRERKKRGRRYRGLTALLIAGMLLGTGQEASAAEPVSLEAAVVLSVENEVKGDVPSVQESFTFVLVPDQQDMPMPQDDGDRISICGNGRADFGTIVYSEPGNYYYTIFQEKGENPLYRYDETVYSVTVQVVTDDDAALHAGIYMEKAGASGKTAKAVFTNFYKEPKEETETGPNSGDENKSESGGKKEDSGWPDQQLQQSTAKDHPSTGDDSSLLIFKNAVLLLASAWVIWRLEKRRNRQKS